MIPNGCRGVTLRGHFTGYDAAATRTQPDRYLKGELYHEQPLTESAA